MRLSSAKRHRPSLFTPVVEHLDMGKDFSLGLVTGEQLEVVEVFAFETAVKAFLLGICLGQDGTVLGQLRHLTGRPAFRARPPQNSYPFPHNSDVIRIPINSVK